MKRRFLRVARTAGLLPLIDRLMLLRSRRSSKKRNRLFSQSHPSFTIPPDDLSFDAYNHVDALAYYEMGRRHAKLYADVIAENEAKTVIAILEWGCGPGRIIRHLRDFLPGRSLALTGTDNNVRSIEWSKKHIQGANFLVNESTPPLPFADGSFDIVYSCSVFTHLSEASQLAWSAELARVLKPAGLMICSTHGSQYYGLLAEPHETRLYHEGQLIVHDGYEEGKKWFLAIHPPEFVKNKLLAGYSSIRSIVVPSEAGFLQDLWLARKN